MEMEPTVIAGYHDQVADILLGVNFRKGLLEGSSYVAPSTTSQLQPGSYSTVSTVDFPRVLKLKITPFNRDQHKWAASWEPFQGTIHKTSISCLQQALVPSRVAYCR